MAAFMDMDLTVTQEWFVQTLMLVTRDDMLLYMLNCQQAHQVELQAHSSSLLQKYSDFHRHKNPYGTSHQLHEDERWNTTDWLS